MSGPRTVLSPGRARFAGSSMASPCAETTGIDDIGDERGTQSPSPSPDRLRDLEARVACLGLRSNPDSPRTVRAMRKGGPARMLRFSAVAHDKKSHDHDSDHHTRLKSPPPPPPPPPPPENSDGNSYQHTESNGDNVGNDDAMECSDADDVSPPPTRKSPAEREAIARQREQQIRGYKARELEEMRAWRRLQRSARQMGVHKPVPERRRSVRFADV